MSIIIDGGSIWVEKGAPQVILDHSANREDIAIQVTDDIDHFATKGYRSLGLAMSNDGTNEPSSKSNEYINTMMVVVVVVLVVLVLVMCR